MTKTWNMVGAAGGAALVGLSLYVPLKRVERINEARYVSREAVAPEPVARPMGLDESVLTLLPTLEAADPAARKEGVETIALSLKNAGKERLAEEARERTARALIDVIVQADAEGQDELGLKRSALRVLMTQVGGKTARDYVSDALSNGSGDMKLAALETILEPGAVRGGEISEKALQLVRTELVPAERKPALLRRLLGGKAEEEILAMLSGEAPPAVLKACVVELQNMGKVERMGAALARLDEAGLLKDAKHMPWMSGRVLSEHIKAAEGAELIRALRVVWLRPHLTRATMRSAQERIAHADPQIRRMVARIVPDAVKYEGIDADSGEELLAKRLEVETDPGVKGEIEGSLAQVRQARRPQDEVQESVPVTQ